MLNALAQGESIKSSGGLLGSIFSIGGSLLGFLGSSGPGPLPNSAGFAESFAHGGRPRLNQPSIVGERGRELFVPDVAGTIIPNSELGGGGGRFEGSPVFIDARGASMDTLREVFKGMRQLRTDTPKIAVAAVVDARRRSPGLFR